MLKQEQAARSDVIAKLTTLQALTKQAASANNARARGEGPGPLVFARSPERRRP